MRELKYIIVQRNKTTEPKAILFNGEIVHSSMVPPGYKAISAGFVNIKSLINIEVYGESISLDLKSDVSDSEIIYNTLNCLHFM